uniref:Uncharacterized protein n=1 Tax=Megaselia scalaris TaxID=36166 RepID=T1GB64_MEGSC
MMRSIFLSKVVNNCSSAEVKFQLLEQHRSTGRCSKNFEGLEWTQIGDFESKTSKQYFICRGFDKESNCVGTFVTESKDICYAICNEKSKELKDFEILQCAESGIWAPVFDQYIPYNSFDLGKSEKNPSMLAEDLKGKL